MKNKEEIKQEKQRTLVFLDKATVIGDVKGIGKTDKNGFVVFGEGKENEANPNPFRKEGLKYESVPYDERITSIPSPYARMHITELAFYEYNCGNALSKDYKRAMSHCLDIFELIYHSHELDLRESGITLQKITLYSGTEKDDEIKNLDSKTKIYLQSLSIYRKQYIDEYIKSRKTNYGVSDYHFDFTSLYVLKNSDGKVFGATSPFTGFFAKADCDLKDKNGKPLLGPDNNGRNNNDGYRLNRNFLTGDPVDWCLLDDRDDDFIKFMYRLLKKTRLCYIFEDMFGAIKDRMEGIESDCENKYANDQNFNTDYPQFNIGGEPLQKIKNLKDVYIRPDGLDCSYLKYLLYLEKDAVDLTIKEYDDNIDKRKFPDMNGKSMHWIGPNDILSDALVVLPYDINENYMSVPYLDCDDTRQKNRCLIPIKPFKIPNEQNVNHYEAFYRFWKDLIGNDVAHKLTIERKKKKLEDGKEDIYFVVKLKVMLEGAGEGYTVLRREYRFENSTTRNASDGVIVMSHNDRPMTFAFGLYPFVRTTKHYNIYKVLFYNNFNNDDYNKKYSLKFYQVEGASLNDDGKIEGGNLKELSEETKIVSNKTNSYNDRALKLNCHYYNLSCEKNLLVFIELHIGDGDLTALIVPKIRNIKLDNNPVYVSVDLGTSNTYVAYLSGKVIKRINTHHTTADNTEWNELTFMNVKCEKDNIPPEVQSPQREQYWENLSLPNDSPVPESICLDSQLLEFIPSRLSTRDESKPLSDSDKSAYLFPIPTVMNFLRRNCEMGTLDKFSTAKSDTVAPLVYSSIPFAYYDLGARCVEEKTIDDIVNGSKFKWFKSKTNGEWSGDPKNKAAFQFFLGELLFIVRSHLLCGGYDLNNCTLIWSYPLSFSQELKKDYEESWKLAYENMISPNSENKIICTNESCSPLYYLSKNTTENCVVLDIGGGSSDVLGYKDGSPYFITSFGFAGNSLYCEGELNKEKKMKPEANYFVTKAKKLIPEDFEIDKNSSSVMMNYGFAKKPREFERIFDDDFPKYMLFFHNVALVYHVAQLCKISSKVCPAYMHLSGNGSKLFYVNSTWKFKDIIKNIFTKVYRSECDITVDESKNPKAATAEGALECIILSENESEWRNKLSDDSMERKVVMLGDDETVYSVHPSGDVEYGAKENLLKYDEYKTRIDKNVREFLDLFYSEDFSHYHRNSIKREKIEDYLAWALEEERMKLKLDENHQFKQSLFFQCISLIMEKIMIEKYYNNI